MITPLIELFFSLTISYRLCYTCPMIIKHTRDTLSETYLDAVAIRNTVFVKGQGVPRSIEIDANEAYCIHFVLYDDKGKAAATVRLLPNKDLTQVTLQRMAVLDAYQGQGLGSILLKEAEDFDKNKASKLFLSMLNSVHLSSTSIMAIKKSVTSLKKLVSNTLLLKNPY